MKGPKPLIEEHYHIQALIEGQQKRVDDREDYRNRQKEGKDRLDSIKDAQLVAVTDFYCSKCREDFKSMSIKEVEIDWTCPSQNIAFYRSKCDEGHWCIRYITDKISDPFWMSSQAIARDRGKHFKDIVQPFETGYNLLYGKK